jgi:hypothetical protein
VAVTNEKRTLIAAWSIDELLGRPDVLAELAVEG